MKNLNLTLSDILHYAIPGAVGPIVFLIVTRGMDAFSSLSGPQVSAIVLIAAVIGAILYPLHRAVYPLLVRPHVRWLRKNEEPYAILPPKGFYFEDQYRRNLERWKRKAKFPDFQRNPQLSAAHVHVLYCACWATLCASFIGRFLLVQPMLGTALITNGAYGPVAFVLEVARQIWLYPTHQLIFQMFVASSAVGALAAFKLDFVHTRHDWRLATPAVWSELEEALAPLKGAEGKREQLKETDIRMA